MSRSSGYSNAAYCNMYDPDDDEGLLPPPPPQRGLRTPEVFVDEPDGREPPLGASGSFRFAESRSSTPNSTPVKAHPARRRQRSFSAPRHASASASASAASSSASVGRDTVNVFAPMFAQAKCNQEASPIRRSKSAVFVKESEDYHAELIGPRGTPWRRTCHAYRAGGAPLRYAEPPGVPRYAEPPGAPRYAEPLGAPRYAEPPGAPRYAEPPSPPRYADLAEPLRYSEPVAGRNLAIIPPSTRPLLPPSPCHSPPHKAPWASPSCATRLPAKTLTLSGLFLLFTSAVNCLLCFYLLAKLGLQKGRHYYIDFAVISGFVMLVLGFAATRMGRRWEWALNRNYLAGYMVLSMLDVLLCGVLGLLASDWRPPDLPEVMEVASGAVCGLSALMLLLALCLGASSCCKTPPPDNRVSHSVPSFII